jgi:DNA-binding response OmpR family regulator
MFWEEAMKILLIDSDHDLVEMLTSWLKTLGYQIYRAYTIERARFEWLEQKPDLVLMETSLNGADTLALCRQMCLKHDALVMVVTEEKNVHDEIRCLDAGADDYLRKPFFPSQLLAHIRAITRRARATLEQRPSSVVTVGPISVDSLHNQVHINGKVTRLTPTESKLLHLLALNANDVCTASQIVAHVWGYDGDADSGLIKAHIRHLRKKIEPDPANPLYIQTVPGLGYTLIRRSPDEQQDLSHDGAYPLCTV